MAALLASKRATELANNAGWRIADVDVARFHCYRYQNSLLEFVVIGRIPAVEIVASMHICTSERLAMSCGASYDESSRTYKTE